MSRRKRYTLRYLLIVSVFCIVSVVYLGRLFYMQIFGRTENVTDNSSIREVTVEAVRGEIYF
jgi:cell division protein FtsI/penicillin-binding protein 2